MYGLQQGAVVPGYLGADEDERGDAVVVRRDEPRDRAAAVVAPVPGISNKCTVKCFASAGATRRSVAAWSGQPCNDA